MNIAIIILIILSIAYNVAYQPYKFSSDRSILVKLMGVNLMPYFFYFLLGSVIYINWSRISKWYIGKGLYWLAAYFSYCFIYAICLHKFELTYWTNAYHFIAIVLLAQATISVAFSFGKLSKRLLAYNDLSYGIYLYHMPVINILLVLGYGGTNLSLVLAIVSIIGLAFLSWRFVEKPALLHKKRSINKELPLEEVQR